MLVRVKDKIYLVKENDMQPEAKFSLVSVVDDKHFILDQEGNEYELQLQTQKDEELQRVLQILKGENKDSSFAYSINASQSGNLEPESSKP